MICIIKLSNVFQLIRYTKILAASIGHYTIDIIIDNDIKCQQRALNNIFITKLTMSNFNGCFYYHT